MAYTAVLVESLLKRLGESPDRPIEMTVGGQSLYDVERYGFADRRTVTTGRDLLDVGARL